MKYARFLESILYRGRSAGYTTSMLQANPYTRNPDIDGLDIKFAFHSKSAGMQALPFNMKNPDLIVSSEREILGSRNPILIDNGLLIAAVEDYKIEIARLKELIVSKKN